MKICFDVKYDKNKGGSGGYKFIGMLSEHLKEMGMNVVYDIRENYDIYFSIGAQTTIDVEIYNILLPRKKKGLKIIHRLDGIGVSRYPDGDVRIRELNKIADFTIFQSEFCRRVAMKSGLNLDNSTVIYNGVDTDLFNREVNREPNREGNREWMIIKHQFSPVLLYIEWSAPKPNKGFQRAITLYRDFLNKYPNSQLRLIGRYDGRVAQDNFGFGNIQNITCLGRINPVQLAKEMRSADVLLFPSCNDWCPNVVLEAMSSGLPIVYNSSGGTMELMNNMGVVWNNSVASVERAISEKKELSEKYRMRAMSFYRKDIMCEQYLEIIAEVIGENNYF